MYQEQRKSIEWRFSVVETIGAAVGLATITAGIMAWSFATFQRKDDAAAVKAEVERRLEGVEGDVRGMRTSVDGVAKDVSYIRGRLEPQGGSK